MAPKLVRLWSEEHRARWSRRVLDLRDARQAHRRLLAAREASDLAARTLGRWLAMGVA